MGKLFIVLDEGMELIKVRGGEPRSASIATVLTSVPRNFVLAKYERVSEGSLEGLTTTLYDGHHYVLRANSESYFGRLEQAINEYEKRKLLSPDDDILTVKQLLEVVHQNGLDGKWIKGLCEDELDV